MWAARAPGSASDVSLRAPPFRIGLDKSGIVFVNGESVSKPGMGRFFLETLQAAAGSAVTIRPFHVDLDWRGLPRGSPAEPVLRMVAKATEITLRHLDLDPEADLDVLAVVGKNTSFLCLDSCSPRARGDLSALGNNPRLHTVSFWRCPSITGDIRALTNVPFVGLRACPNVLGDIGHLHAAQEVDLEDCDLVYGDIGRAFQNSPVLRKIRLCDMEFVEGDVSALAGPRVESVDLDFCPLLTGTAESLASVRKVIFFFCDNLPEEARRQ